MSQFKALLLATIFIFAGCGEKKQDLSDSFRMGEKMQVGPFVYNVLETKWVPHLGDMLNQRIPEQRFLLVRLIVTNSSNKEAAVPLLRVRNQQGGEFQELQNGQGVDGWLGFLRSLDPAETQEGWIAFDVAPNSYVLECSSGGEDLEEEQLVLVDLPFSMDSMNDPLPAADLQ